MVLCPRCKYKNKNEETACSNCGENLESYAELYYAPDLLYNQALKMIEQEDYSSAQEYLSTAYRLNPGDTDIIELLIDLYIYKKDYNSALDRLVNLLEISPEHEKGQELLKHLPSLISEEEKEKKQLEQFFSLKVSDLYQKNAFDEKQERSEASFEEKIKDKKETSASNETELPSEQEAILSNFAKKILLRSYIMTAGLAVIIILGFSLAYWFASGEIVSQSNQLAGELDMLEESLLDRAEEVALRIDELERYILTYETEARQTLEEIHSSAISSDELLTTGLLGLEQQLIRLEGMVEGLREDIMNSQE